MSRVIIFYMDKVKSHWTSESRLDAVGTRHQRIKNGTICLCRHAIMNGAFSLNNLLAVAVDSNLATDGQREAFVDGKLSATNLKSRKFKGFMRTKGGWVIIFSQVMSSTTYDHDADQNQSNSVRVLGSSF